jgi:hypothetical protein
VGGLVSFLLRPISSGSGGCIVMGGHSTISPAGDAADDSSREEGSSTQPLTWAVLSSQCCTSAL